MIILDCSNFGICRCRTDKMTT